MTDFRDDFQDSYFAECDEHLSTIRQALLQLEGAVGRSKPDRRTTEELFRSFHSLKGLAGMVEDREAELLAHEMEGYLRAVHDGDVHVTTPGIEALIAGAAAVERTVSARRRRSPPPQIEAILDALRGLARDPQDQDRDRDRPAHTATAVSDTQGQLEASWECLFAPSPPLIDRGINVEVVRARLRAAGEIVSATPLVDDRGVAFRFLVSGPFDPVLADGWRADGMLCRALTAPPLVLVPPAGEPDDHHIGPASGHYVRVDLSKLDELMRMIGDLVIVRARLADVLTKIEPHVPAGLWRAVQDNALGVERQLRELRDGVMRVRLVPVREVFSRMPFVVRDLARESGRRINVQLSGQDTEIDKYLVERMMDPVLHLVRNAVTHGLESAEERVAAGKPPEGTIRLGASASGDAVRIEIADDGRGIDAVRVIARAHKNGLAVPAHIDDAALLDLICSPGFSTRDAVDRGSGRGVGMDVVRTTIEDLGGSVKMESVTGKGTRFLFDLPLTLAITEAFIARVGAQTFAVPQAAVREVIEIEAAAIKTLESSEVAPYRGGPVPVIRLASVLSIPVTPSPRLHAFVVGVGQATVALVVDRILGQREVVVRATVDPLIQVDGVSGATDLGDGRAVLILDLQSMARGTRVKEVA